MAAYMMQIKAEIYEWRDTMNSFRNCSIEFGIIYFYHERTAGKSKDLYFDIYQRAGKFENYASSRKRALIKIRFIWVGKFAN